jgi:hypothetical protein
MPTARNACFAAFIDVTLYVFGGWDQWTMEALSFSQPGLPTPLVFLHPANQEVRAGESVRLSIRAAASPLPSYQWQHDGVDLPGATEATLTLANVFTNDAGAYKVVVSNEHGRVTSQPAMLTVIAYAPKITAQPQSQSLISGQNLRLNVVSDAAPPATFQWYFKGEALVGETQPTLSLLDVDERDAGAYKVIVSNALGSTTSDAATVAITPALTLAGALDTSTLRWLTGGHAAWSTQTATARDGADAAVSGTIRDNEQTWLETLVAGPGTLSFWWKASCERGFDGLRLFIGATEMGKITGEVDWEQKTVEVPAGVQTIRWQYAKDGSASGGQDRAWLDQVVYVPGAGVAQPVHLIPRRRFRSGQFELNVVGEPGRTYRVEFSSDLSSWTKLADVANPTGTLSVLDLEAGKQGQRFYRAASVPQ